MARHDEKNSIEGILKNLKINLLYSSPLKKVCEVDKIGKLNQVLKNLHIYCLNQV
jgi:hypothetical protein